MKHHLAADRNTQSFHHVAI